MKDSKKRNCLAVLGVGEQDDSGEAGRPRDDEEDLENNG